MGSLTLNVRRTFRFLRWCLSSTSNLLVCVYVCMRVHFQRAASRCVRTHVCVLMRARTCVIIFDFWHDFYTSPSKENARNWKNQRFLNLKTIPLSLQCPLPWANIIFLVETQAFWKFRAPPQTSSKRPVSQLLKLCRKLLNKLLGTAKIIAIGIHRHLTVDKLGAAADVQLQVIAFHSAC